jgi:hypothetical protein
MKLAFGSGMTRAKLCSEALTFTASGQHVVLTREQVIAIVASVWLELSAQHACCIGGQSENIPHLMCRWQS